MPFQMRVLTRQSASQHVSSGAAVRLLVALCLRVLPLQKRNQSGVPTCRAHLPAPAGGCPRLQPAGASP